MISKLKHRKEKEKELSISKYQSEKKKEEKLHVNHHM